MTKTISLFLHSEAAHIPKLTWSVINRKYSDNHQNILAVIDLVLALPASSAEVERGFSQLKILKSDIRSTLSEERLNDLLAVKLLSADIQNFDPLPAIELWNTSSVRTRRPLLKDRASQRESSTAVVNVAADNTVVSTASSVAVPIASPVAGTSAEADSNAECVILDPETAPSYSEEALPSASPEEALHDEIIGCTDDDADEERDSGVDDADDSEFEEEFVDRLIQKYL